MRIMPEYGGQSWTNGDDYLEGAPELVVEVAHSRRALAMHAKRDDYRRYGVIENLVLLVEEQQIRWFYFPGGEIRPDREGISRSRLFPGFWTDTQALLYCDWQRMMEVLLQGLASRPHASFVRRLQTACRRGGAKWSCLSVPIRGIRGPFVVRRCRLFPRVMLKCSSVRNLPAGVRRCPEVRFPAEAGCARALARWVSPCPNCSD